LNKLIILPSRNFIKYLSTNDNSSEIRDLGIISYNGNIKEGVDALQDRCTIDKNTAVVFIIPSYKSQVKSLETNKVEKKYLKNIISSEYQDELQLNPQKHNWDFTIVNETKDKYKLLVSFTEKEYIENWISQLIIADMEPSLVTVEQISILNAFYFHKGYKPIIAVDIGYVDTEIIIYDRDKEFFQMDIQIGGNDFTKNIKDIYDVNWDQAKEILKNPGKLEAIIGDKINEKPKLFKGVSSLVDNIIYEIKRSIIFYENRFREIDFDEIMLVGGVSNLENIAWYLGYEIGAEVKKYNYFYNLEKDLKYDKKQLLENNILTFSNLLGGALFK
jgi:type IV pilus assembly protein PilM